MTLVWIFPHPGDKMPNAMLKDAFPPHFPPGFWNERAASLLQLASLAADHHHSLLQAPLPTPPKASFWEWHTACQGTQRVSTRGVVKCRAMALLLCCGGTFLTLSCTKKIKERKCHRLTSTYCIVLFFSPPNKSVLEGACNILSLRNPHSLVSYEIKERMSHPHLSKKPHHKYRFSCTELPELHC